MKIKSYLLITLSLLSWHAVAGEKLAYQNWVVEDGPQTVEAYTANESKSSMGLFCGGNQCSFYLNTNLQCQPETKYSVLLNSTAVSAAIAMKCTQVGNHYFQILEPFEVVLNAIQSGETIGFAVAVNSGAFVVTRFSLAGANEAVARAITQAANRTKGLPKNNTSPRPAPQSDPKDMTF